MITSSATNISEDNGLRSQFVWHLINDQNNFASECAGQNIPRVLIQFWNDGESIPLDVQECIESWRPLEGYGFKHFLFNDITANDFIKNYFDSRYLNAFHRCLHPAMRSDYFRLCYLLKNGGFYVDADDVYKNISIEGLFSDDKMKIHPLCYDISTGSMVRAVDFILNNEYHPDRIYYVNNDPIISPPDHPLIQLALERSTQILLSSDGNIKDVQSTTGPGNLTASLVRYTIELESINKGLDCRFLDNWDNISISQWPLEYRKDKRNWRIWDGSNI